MWGWGVYGTVSCISLSTVIAYMQERDDWINESNKLYAERGMVGGYGEG